MQKISFIKQTRMFTLNISLCPLFSSGSSNEMSEAPCSYEQKKQVPCIWLSDSCSEKVAADVLTKLFIITFICSSLIP